jgi:endonuclease/exonuclease/phosphatase family metal-dependent hydrolase
MTQDTTLNNQDLADELRRFTTFNELRRSDLYRRRRARIKRLLQEPFIYEAAGARARLRSFLRVVQWNVERGTRLEGIIEALNGHPVLRFADLLLLSELDCGMVRSANRNVALELSRALSAHAIYGAEYLELTKGVGEEAHLSGENTAALHGNAILTRHRFSNAQLIRLPRCENNFESAERRLGGRLGILADLDAAGTPVTAVTTHLDVVGTPRCRARQLRALLGSIETRSQDRRIILGGDFNTHTFARGGRVRTMKNAIKILGARQEKLSQSLLHPEAKEPLLGELTRAGYELDGLNDRNSTSRSIVSSLEDARRLPFPVRGWVMSRVGPAGLSLAFRLDWLAARGLRPLAAGELIDQETGVASVNPQTLTGLARDGVPLSDHDPIVADLSLVA